MYRALSTLVCLALAGCSTTPAPLRSTAPSAPAAAPAAPRVAAVALPRVSAAEAGVDEAALAALIEEARASDSDALVVLRDGKVVVEEYFGRPQGPIETMSATKSVVSLAVGLLLDDGKLRSLDQPVADFFPEWRQGRKQRITVRHLLDHTSGLQNQPTTEEIYRSPDFVKLALAAELTSEPGAVWSYNNKAVNLLAGVVQAASGERMDRYLQRRLFQPLGITDATWTLDSAGNPHGMSGLQIRPADFARLGQLLLQGGVWEGRRLLSQAWIDTSTLKASQSFNPGNALLWWRVGGKRKAILLDAEQLEGLRKAGADPALVKQLAPLVGQEVRGEAELVEHVTRVLGPEGMQRYVSEVMDKGFRPRSVELAPPTGYTANGYLGQYLVVFPQKRLVAVRLYRGPADESRPPEPRTGFGSFIQRVEALVQPEAASRP
jgi:CubicO group peptidase (beta-lactamase class C family)